jgi:ElaB/YqjD/DUF883 family membrane-anchored ribosome-binding protein
MNTKVHIVLAGSLPYLFHIADGPHNQDMRTKTGNGHNVSVDQFMDDLKAVVRDGEELLKVGVSTARKRALAQARTTDQAVREHPYQTIAIVFGVGILIGILSTGMFGHGSNEEED